jgi:hypothetical protein
MKKTDFRQTIWRIDWRYLSQNTASSWKIDHDIGLQEKRQFFRRKLAKIAAVSVYNIDPLEWDILVYFMAVWWNEWPFGTFYGHLVYFSIFYFHLVHFSGSMATCPPTTCPPTTCPPTTCPATTRCFSTCPPTTCPHDNSPWVRLG